MKRGKKYTDALKKADAGNKNMTLDDAIKIVVESHYAKFDEAVDVAINLGIDVKKNDQQVRGAVLLPHGTGKTVKILVFAKGEKEREAQTAGADYVGQDDMIAKVQQGFMDFNRVVATPDMMASVGKLGKILGPRGLMPNPKVGTVTFEVGKIVKELKEGKIEFKAEKNGIVQASIGKVSFGADKLKENFTALLEVVNRLKPAASKGVYVKKVSLSSTMGLGVNVDTLKLKMI
ncbi:MAG: 50S ribosomal protein L1 [Deltaproteobacteria bacterium]|jgi:large subunit ribosomal protein L1|uniref:Large ribosomal subunit protein uL1 n=1 Tax=Candidatus Acidulodesulfobacterium acidiphilum TaxID=2597224 RepID=A0A520XCQ7_9DELT|nr:50S ribosomal protein L1 [Deltaproteobacteria bacterium]MCL6120265.1 50S ribosomal protein L1 [Deltaproteobacteria bacterium]MDA8299863.1 50S ribosomal protein L1 [Deltaproteobacteria bacterium]RZV39003.1 MAG: 50S ribosomal protein L1 [Candidatus Acidulodesulfobacterium acidiphilum]